MMLTALLTGFQEVEYRLGETSIGLPLMIQEHYGTVSRFGIFVSKYYSRGDSWVKSWLLGLVACVPDCHLGVSTR